MIPQNFPPKSSAEQTKDALLLLMLLLCAALVISIRTYFHLSFSQALYTFVATVCSLGVAGVYILAGRKTKAAYRPQGHPIELGEIVPEKVLERPKSLTIGVDDIRHILITGTTGSGKSTLIRRMIREVARHDLPFLLVDFKGDQGDFEEVVRIARSSYLDDRLQVLDLTDVQNSKTCNFLKVFKNVEESVGFVIELFEFDEPFYREAAEDFLRHALRLFDHLAEERSFINLELLLRDELYRKRLLNKVSPKDRQLPFYLFFAGRFERQREDDRYRTYAGFLNKLSAFTDGEFKRIFNPIEASFRLAKLFEDNQSAIIRIPGEAWGELSKRLVKGFLRAIPVLLSKRRLSTSQRDYFLFLDEQCSYPSSNLIDIVKKAGSVKVHCVVTRQCVGDFDRIGSEAEAQMVSACSLKFNFKSLDPHTRDALSKQSGTSETLKSTRRMRMGSDTGEASERDVQEFRVAPDAYQTLKPGECFISARLNHFDIDRKMKVHEPFFDREVINDRI